MNNLIPDMPEQRPGFFGPVISVLTLIVIASLFFGLIYLGYLEIKDWQDTKALIREHNGTCIDTGYSITCGYSEEPQCFQNGNKINCSEANT